MPITPITPHHDPYGDPAEQDQPVANRARPAQPHWLILGGIKSGKSGFAESRALALSAAYGFPVVYLATARAGDAEMAARIARHQQDRQQQVDKADWMVIETSVPGRSLPATLAAQSADDAPQSIVLIDCLTLWITSLLVDAHPSASNNKASNESSNISSDQTPPTMPARRQAIQDELCRFLDVLSTRTAPTVIVSNESSLGIIPDNALSREYLDIVGIFHQKVSNCCENVVMMLAGQPLSLKPPTAPMAF